MAATSPMHLVRTTSSLRRRDPHLQYVPPTPSSVKALGPRRDDAQKMPKADFASSDIISGVHGGRSTNSGRTSPTPGTPRRNERI